MAVTIRDAGIKKLVAGDITDFTIKIGERVEKAARQFAPDFTGNLRRGIHRMPVQIRGLHVRIKVATTSGYGLFPEEGTGIYGPTGKMITPKRKPFLVFKPRGSRNFIRVRKVKGQPGQHYMRDALLAVVRII